MPNVVDDTVDQATAAIQSAGLVVGMISNITSCDVTVGEIASTTPKGGNLVLTVNHREPQEVDWPTPERLRLALAGRG